MTSILFEDPRILVQLLLPQYQPDNPLALRGRILGSLHYPHISTFSQPSNQVPTLSDSHCFSSTTSMIFNYIARWPIDIPLRSPGASPIQEGHPEPLQNHLFQRAEDKEPHATIIYLNILNIAIPKLFKPASICRK